MTKVIAVTPNPALDLTMHAHSWKRGIVNRGQAIEVTPGGKGLTVAINLAQAGIHCMVTGWMGEGNDGHFRRAFHASGLDDQFIRVSGDVRRNIKIIDESDGETTDINMPGKLVYEADINALTDLLDTEVDDDTLLVFGGSLPPGVPTDYYANMVSHFHDRARYIVVDTSDDALTALMAASPLPSVIKPNIHELERLLGKKVEGDDEIIAAGQNFIEQGVELVVISLGEQGAWFIRAEEALHAQPPKVKVASTVGAGDALVAGTVRGLMLGDTLEETARTATAFSAANVQVIGIQLPDAAGLDALKQQVTIRHACYK